MKKYVFLLCLFTLFSRCSPAEQGQIPIVNNDPQKYGGTYNLKEDFEKVSEYFKKVLGEKINELNSTFLKDTISLDELKNSINVFEKQKNTLYQDDKDNQAIAGIDPAKSLKFGENPSVIGFMNTLHNIEFYAELELRHQDELDERYKQGQSAGRGENQSTQISSFINIWLTFTTFACTLFALIFYIKRRLLFSPVTSAGTTGKKNELNGYVHAEKFVTRDEVTSILNALNGIRADMNNSVKNITTKIDQLNIPAPQTSREKWPNAVSSQTPQATGKNQQRPVDEPSYGKEQPPPPERSFPVEKPVPVEIPVQELNTRHFYLSTPNQDGTFVGSPIDIFNPASAVYKFTLRGNNDHEARFAIVDHEAIIADALSSPDSFLKPVCEYEGGFNAAASRIETLEPGLARRHNGVWAVQTPALIRFK